MPIRILISELYVNAGPAAGVIRFRWPVIPTTLLRQLRLCDVYDTTTVLHHATNKAERLREFDELQTDVTHTSTAKCTHVMPVT